MPANFRSLSWATLGYRSIFDFTALHPPPRYARLRLGVKIKDARKGPKSVRLLTCLPTPATLTAMFYYLHLLLLAPFYSLVSILLRRDQDREILLLRQQLLILSRKLSRKPALWPSGEAGLVAGWLAPLETASGQGLLGSCNPTLCFAGIESSCADTAPQASTREAS